MGPAGATGATGPRGATGATGPAGARGKTGPAAKIPRISCRLSGSPRHLPRRLQGRERRRGTGGGRTPAAARACACELSRASKVYASGSRAAKSTKTTVRLTSRRKVTPGKYTLVVRMGKDVTVRVSMRLR